MKECKRRERVWNKGGGCERGRKGKSEKEGESVERGGKCGMREEDGRGGRGSEKEGESVEGGRM